MTLLRRLLDCLSLRLRGIPLALAWEVSDDGARWAMKAIAAGRVRP